MWRPLIALVAVSIAGASFALPPLQGQQNQMSAGIAVTNPNFDGGGNGSGLPTSGSISSLQQQEAGVYKKLDIPQKVNQLQQQLSDMRGLIEIQGHELQSLELKVKALELAFKQANPSAKQPVATSSTSPQAKTQATNSPSKSKTSGMQGDAMYLQAYQLIQEKQYTPAMQLLTSYLKQYPNGGYAMSAHYWLGELYAVSGDAKSSAAQLETVVNNYPQSGRVPDAMLKLGIIAYSQSQYQQASSWYNKLISKFPNSSAAQIAQSELEQMQRAGYVR